MSRRQGGLCGDLNWGDEGHAVCAGSARAYRKNASLNFGKLCAFGFVHLALCIWLCAFGFVHLALCILMM
jgi:hypothetical protein